MVGAAAKKAGTALAIFVDELQYVKEEELAALITALHRTAQRLPADRARWRWSAATPRPNGTRQVLRGAAVRLSRRSDRFPNLRRERRSRSLSRRKAWAVEEAALQLIVQETRGYPYFLQEWGKHAWEIATASPITRHDVALASKEAVAALDESFFRVRFDRLTPAEKTYLRAMAELGSGPHRSGDIAELLGRKVTSLGPTRSQLIARA